MYVVAGVSGHTGSVVASTLLSQNQQVRVLVRSEDKGRAWRDKGAEVAVAPLEDEAAVTRALSGAAGVYLLLPPDFAATDPIARGRALADTLTAAVARAGVPHVVLLSSVGAQHPEGTGPVKQLYYAEQKLRAIAGTRSTFVRAAYFMENLGGSLQPVQAQGVLPAIFDPARAIPMVATHDIGLVAARALREAPTATQVIELAGPREYSFNDVGRELASALGKPVQVVRVPSDQVTAALVGAGMPAPFAALYSEMGGALDSGLMAFEGGAARLVRGATTLESFIPKLLGR